MKSDRLYIGNYITNQQHDWLINKIDEQTWLDDLKRRTQHYGYKYDYRARRINTNMFLGELPEWLTPVCAKLYNDGVLPFMADQIIVNEYIPPQGILPHIDCEPCFGDTIASMSLGSKCIMDLTNITTKEKRQMVLEPKSLLVLSNEMRYNWTHGIVPRKSDMIEGRRVARERRVSLTFRKVII